MKYEIRTISIFYHVLIFGLCSISIVYFGLKLIGIMESGLAFGFSIFVILLSYFISLKLTIGRVQINLTNKNIEYLWLKKPILTFQENLSLNLENIESWKYQTEYQYNYFKVYGVENNITIMRLFNWSPEKDDFDKFLFAFKNTVIKINKRETKFGFTKSEIQIQPSIIKNKETDFYKSDFSKYMLLVYLLSVPFGIYYVLNNWNTKVSNLGLVVNGIFGCIFYINKYYKLRKEK